MRFLTSCWRIFSAKSTTGSLSKSFVMGGILTFLCVLNRIRIGVNIKPPIFSRNATKRSRISIFFYIGFFFYRLFVSNYFYLLRLSIKFFLWTAARKFKCKIAMSRNSVFMCSQRSIVSTHESPIFTRLNSSIYSTNNEYWLFLFSLFAARYFYLNTTALRLF